MILLIFVTKISDAVLDHLLYTNVSYLLKSSGPMPDFRLNYYCMNLLLKISSVNLSMFFSLMLHSKIVKLSF